MRRIQHNQDFVYQESPFSIPDNRRHIEDWVPRLCSWARWSWKNSTSY